MSNYVVSARKYRPQKFSEVVGQQHIVGTLKNALLTDHLAHSFLFCGPRGVGKTTTARILARTLNCENVQNGVDPCGECKACKSFQKNASFNIFELDAASNNSVEHIRMLNEQVRVPPSQGSYKVYIIDEVHMLSSAAFNAFLKTLEEPPPYAIFILATTEKHKIIPTILSRCQIFDFKRIMVDDMVEHLQYIAKEENIEVERDALTIIAQKADGALRDALSLFDRLASVSDGQITYRSVVDNLNILDFEIFFGVVDACLREDVRSVLLTFDDVLKNGFEGDAFLSGIATHLRDLLVCKDKQTHKLLHHSEELKQRYIDQAAAIPVSYLFSALNLLNEADLAYPRSNNKRLHVEIALGKLCFMNRAILASPFSEEKKTHDISSPAAKHAGSSTTKEDSRSNKAVEDTKDKVQTSTSAVDPTKDDGTTAQASSGDEDEATENEEADKPADKKPGSTGSSTPSTTSKRSSADSLIPKLGSISAIETTIKQKEQEDRKNSRDLNIENIRQWWKEYQRTLNSPSVISTFKHTELALNGTTISLKVKSEMGKTRIQQETDLLMKMRREFSEPKLELEFEIDESLETEAPRKPLSTKEKYDHLVSKNPSIKSLKEKLELGVDHDD